MKKCLTIKLDNETYRLRLTLGGQKRLKQRFGEEITQTVLSALGDGETMAALLGEALNWEDSGNKITDGEEFYDLLVDNGYAGQEGFGGLALDLAAVSGLFSEKQAKTLKKSLTKSVEAAFAKLDGQNEPAQEAQETPRPTTENN